MSGRHIDSRHPSEEFLAAELEADRRGEHGLIWKTVIALALCAVLVVIRQLFFV
jgi:hypothetical protein